jgi:hypothetical protein
LFDESALVALIKIHPQTKEKHKEVQTKPRGVGEWPLDRHEGPENVP